MKKIIILASLILFTGIGLCLQAPSPAPSVLSQSKQNEAKPKQTKSTNHERGSDEYPLAVKIISSKTSESKESNATKSTNENTTTNWLLVFFNGFLALFTLGLYTSTRKMWKSTQKAAEAAKAAADALPLVERAYVFVTIEEETPLHFLRITGDSDGAFTFNACIFIQNHGKTPAVINKIYGVISLGSVATPENVTSPDELETPPGLIVGGNDKFKRIPIRLRILENERESILMKNAMAYCCGRIEYEDIFHSSRVTNFCWEYRPSKNLRPLEPWIMSYKYKDLNYYT